MRKISAVLAGMALASSAHAAVVTYYLSLHESPSGTVSANQFAVYAAVSQADNAGLFAFGVDLHGTGDAGGPTTLTLVNRAPAGRWDVDPSDPNYQPELGYPTKYAGFGAGRSVSGVTGIVSGVTDLAKGADLVPIFGIGQQANLKMNDFKPPPDTSNGAPVAYANYVAATGSDQVLGNPPSLRGCGLVPPAGAVRLLTGSWTGAVPSFELASANNKASVWKLSHPNNNENEIAQLVFAVRDFASLCPPGVFNVSGSAVGNQRATDGRIVVTGSNGNYISEMDQLVADANSGTASVQTIGDELGTLYVMAQITGIASDVNAVLAQFNNTAGDAQAPLLHAAYDSQFGAGGFNLLFKMPNFAGAKSINWDFSGNPGAVVNELAVVPEPQIALAAMGGCALLARRRICRSA